MLIDTSICRRHHNRKHERPVGCEALSSCDTRTADPRDMNRHYWSAHKGWAKANNIPNEEKECPNCGEQFTRGDNMTRHLKGGKCRRRRHRS